MRITAKIVAYLFNPLIITTVVFYLLSNVFPLIIIPIKVFSNILLGTLFVVSFLVPVVSLLAMKKMGVISDLMIGDRTQRTIPLIYTAFIYFASSYFIFREPHFKDYMVSELLVFAGVLMLIVAFITRFWKISAHATGMGGVLGLLFRLVFMYYGVDYIYVLSLAIIATGVVMTARLYLGAHTPKQTLAGLVLGAIYALGSTNFIL